MNQTQAHFSDLDDEIIADDWLVPQEEISRRRLFKQTTRYNIYKADWFGDVLVYEPRARKTQLAASRKPSPPSSSREEEDSRAEELRLRLASLDLYWADRQHNPIAIRKPQGSLSADSDQADSAYSSISSTPHYHSKSLKCDQFEFPQQSATASASTKTCGTPSLCVPVSEPSSDFKQDASPLSEPIKIPKASLSSPRAPVILNRDSYVFDFDEEASTTEDNGVSKTGSSWQELNELRLIAHETFMLFMGASVADQSYCSSLGVAKSESTTSLVMQMNHPKAVSLRNLLQNSHQRQLISPIDRFFSTKQQHLGVAAKLNICQQIRDAMTYLHDKNIVHGRLTSVNIYIEPNQTVKISLIDNDEKPLASLGGSSSSSSSNTLLDSVEFNTSALAYLSPELMRTLKVAQQRGNSTNGNNLRPSSLVQIDTSKLTKKSDIFSFGTIIYELFYERLPFERSPAVEVIYRIGSGQLLQQLQAATTLIECPALVQQTISACWLANADQRPNFKQLKFSDSY